MSSEDREPQEPPDCTPDTPADEGQPRPTPMDIREVYPARPAADSPAPESAEVQSAPPPDDEAEPARPVEVPVEPLPPAEDVPRRTYGEATPGRPRPVGHIEGGAIMVALTLIMDTRAVFWRAAWLFFPMGLLPQVPLLFAGDFQPGEFPMRLVFLLLFSLLLHAVATGAMMLAVAHIRVYGRVRLGRCFSDAAQIALPLLLVYVIVGLTLFSCIILIAVLIGLPLLLYFMVTLFFAPHTVAIERLNPLMALGKSRWLVRGYVVRAFVIGLIFLAPFLMGMFVALVAVSLLASGNPMLANVLLASFSAVFTLYVTIGGTLTYFYLRQRHEDYDLEQLKAEIEQG